MHRFRAVLPTLVCVLLLPACDSGGGETVDPEPTPVAQPAEEQPDPPKSALGNGRVTGLLRAPTNANPMPAGSKFQVMIRESDANYDSKVIMQHEVPITGPAPWAFEITLDEASFDPTHGYGVSTMVVDDKGEVWFMSVPKPIKLAEDPDTSIELSLDPADPRAVSE